MASKTKTRNIDQYRELVDQYGFSEDFVSSTPKAALDALLESKRNEFQAKQQAEKASKSRPPKKSAYDKFMEKCEGQMGEGIYKMVSEYFAGKAVPKENLSTTERYMGRNYGPVVVAVLYEQGLLSEDFSKAIKEYYS